MLFFHFFLCSCPNLDCIIQIFAAPVPVGRAPGPQRHHPGSVSPIPMDPSIPLRADSVCFARFCRVYRDRLCRLQQLQGVISSQGRSHQSQRINSWLPVGVFDPLNHCQGHPRAGCKLFLCHPGRNSKLCSPGRPPAAAPGGFIIMAHSIISPLSRRVASSARAGLA